MSRFGECEVCTSFPPNYSSAYNHFNLKRHLYSRTNLKARRDAAHREWREFLAA